MLKTKSKWLQAVKMIRWFLVGLSLGMHQIFSDPDKGFEFYDRFSLATNSGLVQSGVHDTKIALANILSPNPANFVQGVEALRYHSEPNKFLSQQLRQYQSNQFNIEYLKNRLDSGDKIAQITAKKELLLLWRGATPETRKKIKTFLLKPNDNEKGDARTLKREALAEIDASELSVKELLNNLKRRSYETRVGTQEELAWRLSNGPNTAKLRTSVIKTIASSRDLEVRMRLQKILKQTPKVASKKMWELRFARIKQAMSLLKSLPLKELKTTGF